ncbi:homeobox protein prophet of Pit-1-like [Chiloscyllium punctatum]|uniref:homeobox protein prophet of Pit-1-like n=1 Tax=Chiloscyllium punctatum TaxID=137246 RepID=UPI003B6417E9
MAMERLQFTETFLGKTPESVASWEMGQNTNEEISLMEATLMTSPQAAVNGPRRRKRTKYNSWQKNLLEKAYSVCKYPNVWTRETLSKALNVDDARIIVWFQNRRARYSRQSAAVRQRGRPSGSDAREDQPPEGTLLYGQTPASGSACCPRRPLVAAAHGPNVQLTGGYPPLVGSRCPQVPRGPPKVESGTALPAGHGAMDEAVAAACSQWYPGVGCASGNPPARFPVDEIEVDFTVADFNLDLGNPYLLDLSQTL